MLKLIHKLRNINIGAKLNISISALLIVIFTVIGAFLYFQQRATLIENVSQRMSEQVTDLANNIQHQVYMNQTKVNGALVIAHDDFYSLGGISEIDTVFINMAAINQISKDTHFVAIKRWLLDSLEVQDNYNFVDRIKSMTVETATIFQKIDKGYLRISTNVMKENGTRAVGTYIPNNSPVIQTIERGETFTGRAYVVNDWYLTAYEPILINGVIKGILYVGVKEKDYSYLKQIFDGKKYYDRGYPYLVSQDGTLLIHPSLEGKSIAQYDFFNDIKNSSKDTIGITRYLWPLDETAEWKWQFGIYIAEIDSYLCSSIYEKDIYKDLSEFLIVMVVAIIITILVLMVGMYFVIKPVRISINDLVLTLGDMSLGKSVKPTKFSGSKEISAISSSLNMLIDGLKKTSQFATEIGNKNFMHKFEPLSKKDMLGNSLIGMKENLEKANSEEEKRKIEDDQRNWAAQGLAEFSDILRQNTDDIGKQGNRIIKKLVQYLDANQGGLFVLNNEDKGDIHLELIAAYAYNRQKFIKKKVLLGEGLVGTCAIESQPIYLSDVPQDYINITSGLGDANPDFIMLVPLKLNDEVFGVVEIASFNDILEHQKEFIEKIAETIASTLSSVQISSSTTRLLDQSKRQTEELQSQEEEMRQNLEELQATQEDASRRESDLSVLVESINHTLALFEYDKNGIIKEVNDNILQLLGYTRQELIGTHHSIVFDNKDVKKSDGYEKFWSLMQQGQSFDGVMKRLNKNGKEIFVKGLAHPVMSDNGEINKIMEFWIDISEQIEKENDIKKHEKKLQLNLHALDRQKTKAEERKKEISVLVDGINNTLGVFEYDGEGNIIHANEILSNLVGYTNDELLGSHHSIFFDNKNIQESSAYKLFWKQMHNGESFSDTMKRVTKNGSEIIVKGVTKPLIEEGKLVKVIEFWIDITERKELEAKIEDYKSITQPLAIIEYNNNGEVISVNETLLNILKVNEDEIIGSTYDKVFENSGVDDLVKYKEFWETIRDCDSYSGIITITTSSKEYKIKQITSVIRNDQGIQKINEIWVEI